MLKKSKIRLAALTFITLVVIVMWQLLRPARIMAINDSVVFVKDIPITDSAKIKWWNQNKKYFSSEYHLIKNPQNFSIVFMNFGKGFQERPDTGWRSFDKSEDDFVCFANIKKRKRCIYKHWTFDVSGNLSKKIFINIADRTYVQTPDRNIELMRNK